MTRSEMPSRFAHRVDHKVMRAEPGFVRGVSWNGTVGLERRPIAEREATERRSSTMVHHPKKNQRKNTPLGDKWGWGNESTSDQAKQGPAVGSMLGQDVIRPAEPRAAAASGCEIGKQAASQIIASATWRAPLCLSTCSTVLRKCNVRPNSRRTVSRPVPSCMAPRPPASFLPRRPRRPATRLRKSPTVSMQATRRRDSHTSKFAGSN